MNRTAASDSKYERKRLDDIQSSWTVAPPAVRLDAIRWLCRFLSAEERELLAALLREKAPAPDDEKTHPLPDQQWSIK